MRVSAKMTAPDLAARRGPAWTMLRSWREALSHAPTMDGAAAAAIGIVVLLGWVTDVDALKSILPGLLTMKANTAVCFILLGAGVVLRSRATGASRGRSVGLVLIGAAAIDRAGDRRRVRDRRRPRHRPVALR